MSEHEWVRESLALFVAGGLSEADAERIEEHLPACTPCAEAFEEIRVLDRRLESLFAPLRPTSAMEENVLQTLRQTRPRPVAARTPRRRTRRPATRPVSGRHKFLIALGVLFFIAAGAVVTGTMLDPERGLQVAWTNRATYENGGFKLGPDLQGGAVMTDRSSSMAAGDPYLSPEIDPARLMPNLETNFDVDRIERFSVPGKVENDQAIGIKDGDKSAAPTNLPAPGGFGGVGQGGGIGLPLPGSFYGRSGSTRVRDIKEGGGSTRGSEGQNGEAKGWAEFYFRPDSLKMTQDPTKTEGERQGPSAPAQNSAIAAQGQPPKSPPDDNAPLATRKIVIRTGTMLFEVESFDVAVAMVTKLVVDTKGAYVNHKDSEKLANGKVRGTIVVRMPPEQLDEFVVKLLRDVGKVGELRMQRVNSQDVTKQYTDLESELRSHRTMEERLLKIIRDGKGEIKDLLAAERQLGEYRTKIEKIEGEMRYYANQAALSTLTIDLVEKEIRQAAVVEEMQRVQTGIEVEDVEKALRLAEAAIDELKGRILVSKLNEHKGGQYSADLQFTTPPENAGALRDRLKQLGNTARLEIDRVNAPQGVIPAAGARDVKTRRGDTMFIVSLYNLAKVEPREIVQVKIAVTDVPATFARLRDEVRKLQGREVKAQAGNTLAELYVDVRRPDDVAFLKLARDAGEEQSRQQNTRPQDPNTTDSKVQIQLDLFDATAIPPRETVKLLVEVDKVADVHDNLATRVKAIKGRTFDVEQVSGEKVYIKASYDVPLTELVVLVREASAAGQVKVQTTTHDAKAPEGRLALGRLQLTLKTRAPLVDREETFGAQFRHGVALSLKGLGYSLLWLVVGVLFFVPWILVAYGCYRLIARHWSASADEPDVELAPSTAPLPGDSKEDDSPSSGTREA